MAVEASGPLGFEQDAQTLSVEFRRSRTIKIAALIALGLNLSVSTIFFVFIDSSGSWLLRVANVLLICGYVGTVVLNATRRPDAAMWLLTATSLINIVISSLVMGLGLGSFCFFVIVPLLGVLVGRKGDAVFVPAATLGALGCLVAVVLVDPAVPDRIVGTRWEPLLLIMNVASVLLFATVVAMYYSNRVAEAQADLAFEHARSEALLLNILPRETANRLKSGERLIADGADDVAILFADLVGSTPLADLLSPDELVRLLNRVFSAFDDLADAHSLEKIKTVGDAYIVVGGLPNPNPEALVNAAEMALAMREHIHEYTVPGFGRLELRLGLHIGPVVAGVIGKSKFSYDLWGDTVNVAARMESSGPPGEIQVTKAVRDTLAQQYEFSDQRTIEVTGKGSMETFLLKRRTATSA